MYVWVNSKNAREIVNWAMEHDDEWLADRFYRAAMAPGLSWARDPPPIWSVWHWRSKRPVLVRCCACEKWEAFKRHRDIRKSGWTYQSEGTYGWMHTRCVETWDEKFGGKYMSELRSRLKWRQEAHDFLFGDPSLLRQYKGVFVRHTPWSEHDFGGVLDPHEAEIRAEGVRASIRRVIDEMPEVLRERLVAVAYRSAGRIDGPDKVLLLGWAESIPPEYDGVEFDDIRCNSELAEELPLRLRSQLPDRLRAIL